MNKLEKIDREEQRAREKIAAIQALLKEIDGKRTEQENLQIVRQVRALKLTREELYGFINDGELPAALAGVAAAAPAPETIYTRRGKRGKARNTPGTETPDAPEPEETPDEDDEADEEDEPDESETNFESEGNSNEER
jgi:hypothetical protein